MELRQLRYFVKVAELNHFTKAAEALHVTQPALSRQIINLEEELDFILFDRKDRAISLTEDGQAFLKNARAILNKVDEAMIEIEERKGLEKGSVTIGLPSTVGSYYFPKIIYQFKKVYPNIQIFLVEEGAIKLLNMIENGLIDLGVVVSPVTSEKVESVPLLSQEMFICLSKENPLSNRKSVSFKDLENDSFILFKEGYFYRKFILSECSKAGFSPHTILESSQMEMIKSLISLNLGISLFTKMVVENDPRIITVPLDPPSFLNLSIAWKKEKYLTRAASAMLDFIGNYNDHNY